MRIPIKVTQNNVSHIYYIEEEEWEKLKTFNESTAFLKLNNYESKD